MYAGVYVGVLAKAELRVSEGRRRTEEKQGIERSRNWGRVRGGETGCYCWSLRALEGPSGGGHACSECPRVRRHAFVESCAIHAASEDDR